MEITLSGLGKRFNRRWLFRNMNHHIKTSTAIIGPNGSGKSTLLQLISGFTLPSEGSIQWTLDKKIIPADHQFQHLAVSAPYLELIEEFTLAEHLAFHFRFKPARENQSVKSLTEIGYFNGEENKPVKQFSSGMKQRLKLLIALYSHVPVVLLDEPTTNMDAEGIAWYKDQIRRLSIPIVIVASNQTDEYSFCRERIDLIHENP